MLDIEKVWVKIVVPCYRLSDNDIIQKLQEIKEIYNNFDDNVKVLVFPDTNNDSDNIEIKVIYRPDDNFKLRYNNEILYTDDGETIKIENDLNRVWIQFIFGTSTIIEKNKLEKIQMFTNNISQKFDDSVKIFVTTNENSATIDTNIIYIP